MDLPLFYAELELFNAHKSDDRLVTVFSVILHRGVMFLWGLCMGISQVVKKFGALKSGSRFQPGTANKNSVNFCTCNLLSVLVALCCYSNRKQNKVTVTMLWLRADKNAPFPVSTIK